MDCVLNRGLDNSEELTSDEDLFRDINPSSSSIIQPNVDPIPSNTDTDSTDSEDAGENSLDNVVLDDYLKDDLEDDGNSSVYEDEGECYEIAEVTVVDMGDDGMDVDEGETTGEMDVDEGVVADEVDPDEAVEKARPRCEERGTAVPFRAGCVWSEQNWSCPYDADFMAFFAIYWQAPPAWRDDWRQQTLEWTGKLADHFDILLEALDSPRYSPEELSQLFSSSRDQFRQQLANHNPQKFPHTGWVLASASAILEVLFGSINGPSIEEHLICTRCGADSQTSHHFPLLALPSSRCN